MHLCLYLDSASTTQLKNAVASLRSGIKSLHLCEKISFHILFSPNLKWSDAPKSMIESYYQFMDTLKELAGSKVYQCSIIHKFDSSTVYITEIDALVALGKDITEDISRWYHLRVLDYSHNFLRLLPGVKFLDSLEILNIGGGGSLETLAGFKMPSNLRVLDVSNNQLKSLDYVFSPSLRRLDVLNNSIYSLDYVKLPQQLAVLDLSHNRIDNIKYVNFPRDLTHLSISFNPMESMKGARFPEKLEYLDISCIPNESMAGIKFPDSILCLNLQLSMTNTRGLKLPPFVQELNMACNELNSINPLKLPNSIQKLYLANNNIKTLSKVTFPTALKELYLGNNLITTLKNVLFPPTLEVLDMEMNPELEDNEKDISSLKDVIFPPNLRVLRLGYHSIKAIESIEFPFSLEELSLQYNDIRMFRNVRFGSKLRYLDLSGNQELMSVDNVLFPETLLEMKIPSTLLSNLPADIVKRANNRELILTKSLPYTI
ncbi:L domain-like protein [Metschnikowia bicuspidata]|uniref:L domain-like protein n=1 Tax=Metschnikowia bicuspidata TaxID=27322 RepID=A0A4P9Z767_9ASCO|nr:L domain-like protein [Metschnikowia bicuspidata]